MKMLPMLPVSPMVNSNFQLIIGNIGNWQHFHIGNNPKMLSMPTRKLWYNAGCTGQGGRVREEEKRHG